MNKRTIGATSAVCGALIGIGGTLLTIGIIGDDPIGMPDTEPVTRAITSYVDAVNNANTKEIGKLSCGKMEADFNASSPDAIAAQLKEAVKQRGKGNIGDFRNVSIDRECAMAAGVITYAKDGRKQENLVTYGLRQVEGQWKICWSSYVGSAETTK